MAFMTGSMGGGKSNGFSPKKPGFASKVGGGGKGNNGKRAKAMSTPAFIKGPRQAKGSKGDGMNGGF